MRAGTLRHRVTFQQPAATVDDFGEPNGTWSDIDTVWARVEPIANKEHYAALHTQSGADYRVVCRYNSALANLAAEDRIVWGSLIFDIKSIVNTEGRNIQLEVFAKQNI